MSEIFDVIEAQSQWQPIETAPKDGSAFLAFGNGEMVVCRMENISTDAPLWVPSPTSWNWDHDDWAKMTHWMPLPEPPVG